MGGRPKSPSSYYAGGLEDDAAEYARMRAGVLIATLGGPTGPARVGSPARLARPEIRVSLIVVQGVHHAREVE